MKFIKIRNAILNVEEIKSIHTHYQDLIIEVTDKTYRFNFGSEMGATEELNRIYKLIDRV